MSDQSANRDRSSPIKKIPSAESFLIQCGNIKYSHEEYTPKVLPPSMREVIKQNTSKLLRRIRSQLREFTKFVEDIQRKTPSEYQLISGSPLHEVPKQTEGIRSVQPVDPRPKNAPLRDAFQMVKNLLRRISNVIDQVAADIPAEDDRRRDVESPNFDYYYAQYVFQLSIYILQTVGEELEQFSKILAEVSVDDALGKLPPRVDEVNTTFSSHKICPERSGIFRNYGASLWSSDTSCEESSSTSNGCLPKVELKKRAVDALELLIFLSEKMFNYFQDKGFPEFDETQQLEFSRRALGIPDLCKNCSKKVARQLRRYSSRENLYAEKYEKSSVEPLLSSDSYQRGKERHAHFNGSTQESYFKSDSKPSDIQTDTKSRIDLGPKSTQISDTGDKMTYHRHNGPFKSTSHGEPLVSGQTETAAMINQIKGTDDVIVGVITVTEDPGKSERSVFTKQSDNINFNLQEFCTLLKEQFRKLLSEENKSNATQSETADSNIIVNTLIQCFREASKSAEESIIKPSSIRFDVTAIPHSSREADVENNISDTEPSKKDDAPWEDEYEKQLDKALEQFVTDTYQLAVAALEKKKSNGGSLQGSNQQMAKE